MKIKSLSIVQAGACLGLGLAALLAPLAASAASAAPARIGKAEAAELRALHQRELAACRNGQTRQVISACVAEAYASYAQALRGGLDTSNAAYGANAHQRCDALSGSDKVACMARMDGQGTVSGSVESGGMLRELSTYRVGPLPAASAPVVPPR
jgi:hypothetical protein